MSFAHPWVLLALLVPLTLAFTELSRLVWGGGQRVPVPVDMPDAFGARWRRRPWLRGALAGAALLPLALLAGAVVLLAGPKKLGPPSEARVMTNIELVLDVSGSMMSPMGTGATGESRYQASMAAIKEFLTVRKGDAFGLTIFGGEVVRWVPLTRDLSVIENATPFLDPAHMPAPMGSTRVGHALKFSMETLARAGGEDEGDRLLILITDGESPDLAGGMAERIGNELRDAGIVVQAVHVGGGDGLADLAAVATPTGGRVFNPQDPAGLRQIFEFIDKMRPARVKTKGPEPIDFFAPIVYACLGLLALHTVSLFGVRYTPW